MVAKQGEEEERVGVVAEIRRQVAEPQAPVRIAFVRVETAPIDERARVPLAPADSLRKDRPAVAVGVEAKDGNDAAVKSLVASVQL
jgi:hypothetical protein